MSDKYLEASVLVALFVIGTCCVVTSQPSFWVWLTL